jgi:predicted nucleotidyltransferase
MAHPSSEPVELFGRTVLVLGLEALIAVKWAAGRPKDYEAIAELEVIREERDRERHDREADGTSRGSRNRR